MRAILASIRLALASLWRSPLRTILTALGILVGIAAVVVVTALTSGARERVGSAIESLGSNLLFIWGKPTTKSGARVQAELPLTDGDALAIRREASAVAEVTVYSDVTMQVESEYENAKIGVMGVDLPYFVVRAFEISTGRLWTESEEQIKSKVCVIGRTAQRKLFGNADPVGRHVRVGRHPFLVIGTLLSKGESPFEDQDDRILMPIGSWRARVSPTIGGRVQLIIATARSPDVTERAKEQIESVLRDRHRIFEGEEDDFRVRTQQAFLERQDRVYDILTALLVAVAAISLLAGGIGVMNIMLVSVTERTREIGIRMAIGARSADIRAQFLVEAIALTTVGGLAGIALAFGITRAIESGLGWSMRLSPAAVAIAIVTSVFVGVAFGYWPARRAATLDPIEALRHE